MRPQMLRVVHGTQKLLKYEPSVQLQEQLVRQRALDNIPDTVLLVQHSPVFTIGKRGKVDDFHTDMQSLRAAGIDVTEVPRGGETTYHGPGQLVAYPIFALRRLGLGARAFVEGLEDVMIATVGCYGLQARGRVPGKTGVWIGERKLGAVGVRITHGISSHGLALNVCTDLSHYRHIVPCGTPDKKMTSIQLELARGFGLVAGEDSCGSSEGSDASNRNGKLRLPRVDLAGAEKHLVRSLMAVFGFHSVQSVLLDHEKGAVTDEAEVTL